MSDYQGNIVIKNPATPKGPSAYGAAPGMWKLNEVAYWIKQGVWPNPAIVPDTYFPYVSLLLSSTSLSNANNNLFVDSSGVFNPISRIGATTQGSSTPYSTNWSNYFDGAGDWIGVTSNNAAFGLGTGDFTIEGWVFATANPANGPGTIYDLRSSPTASATVARINSSLQVLFYNGPANTEFVTGTVALNTWTHIAFVRSSGTLRTYINGTLSNTTTVTSDFGSSQPCYIGVNQTAGYEFNGNISNFRIVKGTAVYTSNFTVPTAPLTAISGTSILTCQSNRFIDNSSNNFAITITGNTSVQDFGPFSPPIGTGYVYNQSDITNWSGYFPGNGSNYLAGPSNAAFAMGTGDFTIEFWAYFTNSADDNGPIFDTRTSANNGVLIRQGNGAGGIANRVDCNCAGTTASSGTITFNAWTHVAVVRASSSLKIYLNGVGGTAVTASGNASASNSYIGAFFDGLSVNFDGYLNNLRVVKGTAVYTTNFTPPTTNLTAISGTSLLTLQNAAFTDNSTNNFVITPFGNTTVTGNSPFNTVGYWSNFFDGTNSYLSTANGAANNLGTSDFTIELWFKSSTGTLNTHACLVASYSSPVSGSWAFKASSGSTGYIQFASYGPSWNDWVTTTNIASDQLWHHCAVTRSGNTLRIFVDGAVVGTWDISGASSFTGGGHPLTTGFMAQDSTSYLNGNVSNLRIVKGTALYTAAFTPPSAPLTAISGTAYLTCQNGRFIDNSTNAFTITPNGNAAAQSFDPFYTATVASNGGSLYFNGSSYLATQNNPVNSIGASDCTIESWVQYANPSSGSDIPFFGTYTGAWGANNIYLGKHSLYGGKVALFINNYSSGSALLVDTTLPTSAWHHYAITRNGSTWRMFRDGVIVATATWSGNATGTNGLITPGRADVLYFNGYLSDMRVTKGVALYTANFTPPTAPLTPSANTVFLLNGMNAGVYDATAINDMDTAGNAQVTTAVSKYGGSSLRMLTASDYVKGPLNPLMAFGTGDFTIEAWVYSVATTSLYTCIFTTRDGTTSQANCVFFGLKPTTNQLTFYTSSEIIGTTTAVTTGVWTHVALVRSSGTTVIYINGVNSGSATFTTSLNGQGVAIGNEYNGASGNGGLYVDDLRVTKGAARYTANFTPPTQAFPIY